MPQLSAGTEVLAIDYPPSLYEYDTTNIDNISAATFTAGSPQVSGTFSGPTSGQVLVIVGGSSKGSDRIHQGVQLREDDSSGLVIETPQVTDHGFGGAETTSNYQYGGRMTLFEGLVQAQTYFARHMYRALDGGTQGDIGDRSLCMIPLPFHWATPEVGAPAVPPDASIEGDLRTAAPPAVWSTSAESQINLDNLDPDYEPGAPQVAVSFIAPASGAVLIVVGGGGRDNDGTSRVFLAPEVREGEGYEATETVGRIVADPTDSDDFVVHGWASSGQADEYMYGSRASVLDGLTPGAPYFARAMHSVETPADGSADLTVREVLVIPLPSTAVYAIDDTFIGNVASSTFADGSPEVGVGFTGPPSGRVLVIVGGGARDNSNDDRVFLAPQIHEGTNDAGAVHVAADVAEHGWSNFGEAAAYMYGSRASVVDVTPGDPYYAKVMHSAQDSSGTASGSADITVRDIAVIPVT